MTETGQHGPCDWCDDPAEYILATDWTNEYGRSRTHHNFACAWDASPQNVAGEPRIIRLAEQCTCKSRIVLLSDCDEGERHTCLGCVNTVGERHEDDCHETSCPHAARP